MAILTETNIQRPGLPALIAALVGALGVTAGAFGAHALEAHLQAVDRVDTWETAAHYHLLHAVVALLAALWGERLSCWLLLAGILIFSGSLYLLCALPTQTWLGAITPLGGLAFIAGWVWLGLRLSRR